MKRLQPTVSPRTTLPGYMLYFRIDAVANNRVDRLNNIVPVKFLNPVFPWQRTRKGMAEVVHDPCQIDCEILHHNERDEDWPHTNTLQPFC